MKVCIHIVGFTKKVYFHIHLCQLDALSPDFQFEVTLSSRDNGKIYSNRDVLTSVLKHLYCMILTGSDLLISTEFPNLVLQLSFCSQGTKYSSDKCYSCLNQPDRLSKSYELLAHVFSSLCLLGRMRHQVRSLP